MLTTEEAGVADSLTTALFPSTYAPSSGVVTGLDQNGFSGSNSNSNNSTSNNNGLSMTFDNGTSNDYAFLLDSHQQDHHKRPREFSEEEIQAQYLDQVEEYQWSQTMAIRTVLQQQHQPHQIRHEQQQEQQSFPYGQHQQMQRFDLGAHSQRSPLQQQPHQQQSLHQSQTQTTQPLHSPLRQYQDQQSYQPQKQQQPYRNQPSGVLDAPQLGSQQGSQLRQQSLGSQQESYQQLSLPQGQQQPQQQLPGYQSQYPLRSPPVDPHPTQQPQRSLSAGMLIVPRGGPDHVTAPATSQQRPAVDSSQFHLSRHQEATTQQQQHGQSPLYSNPPASNVAPLPSIIDTPLAFPSPNIPSFPYFPPAMLVSYGQIHAYNY
ncbi:MAG: hypothetical protein J3R72DRAFT_173921 [Linnemannia gamsii]|nr:MAG: hypothetical protein J3R72DRAFT_173921 [Linnemannia gamsii]